MFHLTPYLPPVQYEGPYFKIMPSLTYLVVLHVNKTYKLLQIFKLEAQGSGFGNLFQQTSIRTFAQIQLNI
jgi:hypothetical protein